MQPTDNDKKLQEAAERLQGAIDDTLERFKGAVATFMERWAEALEEANKERNADERAGGSQPPSSEH